MKTALIGSTGFVGGNLLRQQNFTELYNSKNIGEIAGKEFDLVICAGAPAAMWIANKDPQKDWEILQSLMTPLKTVKTKHFVLISSIAVYPMPIDVDEDSPIDEIASLPYGKHRYALEKFSADTFDTTVVRLPGLFGAGIKKNIVYDFLHGNNLDQINANSVYQFYNLNHLTRDIERARNNQIPVLNISSEPTSSAEVAKHCFGIDFTNLPDGSKAARFDYRSKYAGLWDGKDGYLYSKDQVLSELIGFVKLEQAQSLKVSNT